LVLAEQRGVAAEITPTTTYEENRRSVQRVALHAPDTCEDASISGATGAANNTGQIFQVRCGVWMSEIERALSQRGYVVSSWRQIHNLVRTQNITPVAAAAQLHAQVLFQLNSLERITRKPAQDTRLERDYFLSDATGAPLGPATLLANDVAAIHGLLGASDAWLLSSERLGAMLDANAVWVATGQTMWFYRWLKIAPLSADLHTSVLAYYRPPVPAMRIPRRRRGELPTYIPEQAGAWMPVAPLTNTVPEITAISSEREAVSRGARNASDEDAVYFALVREVVSDFVGQFAGR
jgi:hypothetical protein